MFNLIKRIRVFRNWLTIIRIYQRKTDPNTTIITRNGLKITIRKIIDVAIIDEIFTWKIYDQYPFKLQHDGIVIDIGANIGIFPYMPHPDETKFTVMNLLKQIMTYFVEISHKTNLEITSIQKKRQYLVKTQTDYYILTGIIPGLIHSME